MGCYTQVLAHVCSLKQATITSSYSSLTICPIDSSSGAVNGTDLTECLQAAALTGKWHHPQIAPHVREFSRCPICCTPSSSLYTEMRRTCSSTSLLCEFIVIQCDRVFFQTWSGIAHQMNNLYKGFAATRAAGGKSTVPALLSRGAQTWMPGPLISLRCHYVLLLNFCLARWDLPVVITTECQRQTAACRRLIICVLEKPSSLAVPRVNSGSMSVTLWLSVTYSTRRGEVAKSKSLTQLRVKVDETALNQNAVKFRRIFFFGKQSKSTLSNFIAHRFQKMRKIMYRQVGGTLFYCSVNAFLWRMQRTMRV